MKNVLLAVVLSLAVHGLAALALVLYFRYAPGPDVLATLDLSSVELSFAPEEDDTAAVAPSLPSPVEPPPPRPRSAEPPPPPVDLNPSLPPDPTAFKPVQPEESRPEMETPPPQTPASAAPAVAPRQAKVDAPPKPRRTIRPVYPKGARQRGEQGEVTVEIEVDAEGRVSAVKVVGSSGFAELDDAAVRAVRAATFVPAKSGGRAVESSARLTLAFRLK